MIIKFIHLKTCLHATTLSLTPSSTHDVDNDGRTLSSPTGQPNDQQTGRPATNLVKSPEQAIVTGVFKSPTPYTPLHMIVTTVATQRIEPFKCT